MKRYFLETSVIINYLRGDKNTIDLVESLEGELSSSFVCMAELYEGVARAVSSDKLEQGVVDFFGGLSRIFGLDEIVSRQFGFIRAKLKKQGIVIEDIDIFLSATCVSCDLIMVTDNPKHFSRIEELKLYHKVNN